MKFQLFTLVNTFGFKSYMPSLFQVDIKKKKKQNQNICVMHHPLPDYKLLNYLQVLNVENL